MPPGWYPINGSGLNQNALQSSGQITKPGGGFLNILEKLSPFIPVVGGIAQNILNGINTRKARLYDSPANQVKRFQEAGLPMASTGRITTGGGFTTASAPLGTEQVVQNLGASLKRQIDRKQLELIQEQIRAAKTTADYAEMEQGYRSQQNNLFPDKNNYYTQKDFEMNMLQSSEAIKANEYVISNLERDFQTDLWRDGKRREQFDRQLDLLISNLKSQGISQELNQLNITNEKEMTRVRQDFIRKMESGQFPNLSSIIYALAFGTTRLSDFKY